MKHLNWWKLFVLNFNQIVVGGGIVEKKLMMMNPLASDTNYADEDIESRGLTSINLTRPHPLFFNLKSVVPVKMSLKGPLPI